MSEWEVSTTTKEKQKEQRRTYHGERIALFLLPPRFRVYPARLVEQAPAVGTAVARSLGALDGTPECE